MFRKLRRLFTLDNLKLILGGAMFGTCMGGITWGFYKNEIDKLSMDLWGAVIGAALIAVWVVWRWWKGDETPLD